MTKKILDVTCGNRSIWFNKNHPAAIYADKRAEELYGVWKSENGQSERSCVVATGISLNLAATHMGVSYKKLIKLLIDRNMNKKDLQEEAALSPASITSWQRTRSLALPC